MSAIRVSTTGVAAFWLSLLTFRLGWWFLSGGWTLPIEAAGVAMLIGVIVGVIAIMAMFPEPTRQDLPPPGRLRRKE